MNIIVCIKQVPNPDYFSYIVVDPVTKTIQREGIPAIMNPADCNAVEAALQIKEKFTGKVTVITMGPPKAREALEEALAMGADEAVHLCDRVFSGSDAFATAFTIAKAIKKFCLFDLILCGNETVDSGTMIVGPQLAEFLEIPYVTNAKAIDFTCQEMCIVECPIERGHMKVRLRLPALITVNKAINEPRIPTVMGIMQVANKNFSIYGCDELELPLEKAGITGSPTQVVNIFDFKQKRRLEILKGKPEYIVKEAVDILRKIGAL